jgi:hypothetical protein
MLRSAPGYTRKLFDLVNPDRPEMSACTYIWVIRRKAYRSLLHTPMMATARNSAPRERTPDIRHNIAEEESGVEMVVGRKERTNPQAQSNSFITWLKRSFNELNNLEFRGCIPDQTQIHRNIMS